METKHYVPLEIARRLKAKGYHADRYTANEMALPTYEQVTDWLDNKYDVRIYTATVAGSNNGYRGVIFYDNGRNTATSYEPTREQAINAAFMRVLLEELL